MKLTSAGLTDIGRVRRKNQDNFACLDSFKLYIVADGMGGHKAGEVASQLAVETLTKSFSEVKKSIEPTSYLTQVIEQANNLIYKESSEKINLKGMGTTLTCLYFYKDTLYIAHVGDSRAYFLKNNHIWQLSNDHSLVAEKMVEEHDSPLKNILTRSVGHDPDVEVDVYTKKIAKGDKYLLCSDGLHGLVKNSEMSKLVSKNSLKSACKDLITLANERGGEDNITAVIVSVDEV